MPEGHTLHRLARLHTEYFAGGPVRVSSPQGRFVDSVAVDGRYFDHASATGKHLFHHYEGGVAVHIHLGLYGFFDTHLVPEGQDPPAPVGQVRMRVGGAGESGDGDLHIVDLRGPTRCEVIAEPDVDGVRARLGPDPLDPDADPDRAWDRIRRSTRPIGALLMDQKVLAGVGNVYRAEVLFRAGLDPFLPGAETDREEFIAVWDDLVELMPIGVDTASIVTIRPQHDHGDVPRRGADRPRNYVYQRDGLDCRVCGTPVVVAPMENRSLYWCPGCQPSRS